MSKLSYAVSMLTLAGAGIAQATTVTFNFTVPDYSTLTGTSVISSETAITLAGASAPQFYFGTYYVPCASNVNNTCNPGDNGSDYVALNYLETAQDVSLGNGPLGSSSSHYGSAYGNSGFGLKSLAPGLPSAGETFTKPVVATGFFAKPNTITPTGGVPTDISKINEISYLVASETGGSGDLYYHATFDSNGQTYLGTFHVDTAGNVPSLTYEAVPEPEAWALLIAGTAMVGGAVRSRRRKVSLAA